MVRKAPIKVVQNEEKPIPAEVMAESITAIAKGMRALDRSGLGRETIVVLVADRSRIAKKTVRIILENLTDLETMFLKPKR